MTFNIMFTIPHLFILLPYLNIHLELDNWLRGVYLEFGWLCFAGFLGYEWPRKEME